MNPPVSHVFVSYSRRDACIVTPIVQIMRAVGVGVFHDIDSIPFGKRWRPVIEDSIHNATIVLVFWCAHSCESVEVRKEWELAIHAEKAVVPVLLDDTPLIEQLAEFQALDLRSAVPRHSGNDSKQFFMPTSFDQLPEELKRALLLHQELKSIKHTDIIEVDVAAMIAANIMGDLKKRAIAEYNRAG